MKKELEHSVITVLACVGAFLVGFPLLCFVMPLVFVGREHAQAEYRWIETFGSHRRAYLPWWGGFDRRVWDVHSWWWNMLLPLMIAASSWAFSEIKNNAPLSILTIYLAGLLVSG